MLSVRTETVNLTKEGNAPGLPLEQAIKQQHGFLKGLYVQVLLQSRHQAERRIEKRRLCVKDNFVAGCARKVAVSVRPLSLFSLTQAVSWFKGSHACIL